MLTQDDSDKINKFYNTLADKCELLGVPLRIAGQQEYHNNNGDVYLVKFYFQVMMTRFALYVNTLAPPEHRFGWMQE